MVWGTYAVKIEVQMAFAQVASEIKVPQSARLSEGGCDRYLGNARIDPATFSVGLPFNIVIVIVEQRKNHLLSRNNLQLGAAVLVFLT